MNEIIHKEENLTWDAINITDGRIQTRKSTIGCK